MTGQLNVIVCQMTITMSYVCQNAYSVSNHTVTTESRLWYFPPDNSLEIFQDIPARNDKHTQKQGAALDQGKLKI